MSTPNSSLGTAQQHALESMRRMIISGTLRPGQRVSQDEVARELQLSIAPVREALRVLEKEGQVTYLPRRGYFITELCIEDLQEIYALRSLLEERAARHALPTLDEESLERIALAARECEKAAHQGEIAAELEANRLFHLHILAAPDSPHAMRVLELLWDTTEAYRAIYYNSPEERSQTLDAHKRILAALRAKDADRLVAELNEHRRRALSVLEGIIPTRNA